MPPSMPQLALLWLAGLCFALAFLFGWHSLRAVPTGDAIGAQGPARLGPGARTGFAAGVLLALLLVVWRLMAEGRTPTRPAVPLSNFFDSFLLLGLFLAALGAYFRYTQHLRSLAFFLLPMIAIVLLVGGVLGLLYHRAFDYGSALNIAHVVCVMGGSACFAAGCVGGTAYLLADRQLRRKRAWLRFPSLASLERFNQHAVLIGFPLLTAAMITGALRAHQVRPADPGAISPKIILAVVVWLIYGTLLHIRLAPSFRGRRAAWLSIVGFGLLLSVFFAVLGVVRT